MINRINLSIFAAATFLGIGNANANFLIQNRSDEHIVVSVLTTENFGTGRVNQFETVTIIPGGKHDFITNDVVPGRTITVFIKSQNVGKNYFDQFKNGNLYNWKRHYSRVLVAPYWSSTKKKMGNAYIASQAAQGKFSALANSYGGHMPVRGMQVIPTKGGHKGFKLTYNGYGKHLGQVSW